MSITVDPPLVRQLTSADLTDIIQLQETVTRAPGRLYPLQDRELCAYLDGTLGVAYGIAEGRLSRAWTSRRSYQFSS